MIKLQEIHYLEVHYSVTRHTILSRISQIILLILVQQYQLGKEIGKGNFGTVCEAVFKPTSTPVAIKIVSNNLNPFKIFMYLIYLNASLDDFN